MKRRIFTLVLLVVILAVVGMSYRMDHHSCICYQVTYNPQGRQIGQEITSLYEPNESAMSLVLLTCRHHKRMWLRIFWDQGTYQIWQVGADT